MVWITHTIEINAAGISQIGLENERRLNITPPSTRDRRSHHSGWSTRIRLSNLGRGDADVQQTAIGSNPTSRQQSRIATHEVNLVMSSFQKAIYRYLTLKTKTDVLQDTSELQLNITSRIQHLRKNCESENTKHEAHTSERKTVAQKRTLKNSSSRQTSRCKTRIFLNRAGS